MPGIFDPNVFDEEIFDTLFWRIIGGIIWPRFAGKDGLFELSKQKTVLEMSKKTAEGKIGQKDGK